MDHSYLGSIFYMGGISLGFISWMISIGIRMELCISGNRIFGNGYNELGTLHGLIMIFLFIMASGFSGYGNIIVPIEIMIMEVVYPRLNMYSLGYYIIGSLLLLGSDIIDNGNGIGWTLYPPLSTYGSNNLGDINNDMIFGGISFGGITSTITTINLGCIYIIMRITNQLLYQLSILLWSLFIITIQLIIILPFLLGISSLLEMDYRFNTIFFDSTFGGDPIFFQHLFWFFGHPEVYILIIPIFGIYSYLIISLIQSTLLGNASIIISKLSISILGFFVWLHHMYTTNIDNDTRAFYSSITLIIGIPTGTTFYNYISSLNTLHNKESSPIFISPYNITIPSIGIFNNQSPNTINNQPQT